VKNVASRKAPARSTTGLMFTWLNNSTLRVHGIADFSRE
jgi:hypothetical protein